MHTREWLFNGAGATNPFAALDHQDALPCPGQIGGASQPIVPRPYNNHVPLARSQFLEWRWKADLPRYSCGRGHENSIYDSPFEGENDSCRSDVSLFG